MDPVRRDVAGLTSLRIRQQFSTKISVPRLFPFAYAGGDGIHPGRGRWRTGDMHRRPSIYAPSGIIGEHMHHRGAYLHKNVEICAADPRYTLSTASSGCISPLESPAAARCVRDREPVGAPDPSLRLAASSMVTRKRLRLW